MTKFPTLLTAIIPQNGEKSKELQLFLDFNHGL